MAKHYSNPNRSKENRTAMPSKYPQGWFKDKPCRKCGDMFSPVAPSELYCSNECARWVFSDNYLKKSYGIGKDEYDKMHEDQKGACWICGGEGFAMRKDAVKLAVDHDHDTGEIRGLLCHNCNRALGLFQDSIDNLKQAIKYLRRNK